MMKDHRPLTIDRSIRSIVCCPLSFPPPSNNGGIITKAGLAVCMRGVRGVLDLMGESSLPFNHWASIM